MNTNDYIAQEVSKVFPNIDTSWDGSIQMLDSTQFDLQPKVLGLSFVVKDLFEFDESIDPNFRWVIHLHSEEYALDMSVASSNLNEALLVFKSEMQKILQTFSLNFK